MPFPGLEIEADDVRCTHAATSGRVDEEQIFLRHVPRHDRTGSDAHHRPPVSFQVVIDRIPVEVRGGDTLKPRPSNENWASNPSRCRKAEAGNE